MTDQPHEIRAYKTSILAGMTVFSFLATIIETVGEAVRDHDVSFVPFIPAVCTTLLAALTVYLMLLPAADFAVLQCSKDGKDA